MIRYREIDGHILACIELPHPATLEEIGEAIAEYHQDTAYSLDGLTIEITPYKTLECALTLRSDTWAQTAAASHLLQEKIRLWRRYSGITRTWYIRPVRYVLYKFLDEAAKRGARIVIDPALATELSLSSALRLQDGATGVGETEPCGTTVVR